MSDIGIGPFPLWFGVGIFGLTHPYVLGVAVLALAASAFFGRSLSKPMRWAAGIGAGFAAAPLALGLLLIAGDIVGQSQRAAEDRARRRTLTAAETVAGLPLPAGAELVYSDETRDRLQSIELPRPSTVAGLALTGEIAPIIADEWSGELAVDQTVGGWPCRAGQVWFTPSGAVTRCLFSAGYRVAGYDIPAGAEGVRNPKTGGYEFQLSQSGPAMPIIALGADLPAGGTIVLAADGRLRRLYARHETPMKISGVALCDHIVLDATGATGQLAEPAMVDGVQLRAETEVRVELNTGKIAAAARPDVDPP
jgi:hypothetical protein